MRYLSPLEMLYKWEKERPNEIYLSQPIDGVLHTWTWKETGDEIRKMAYYLKSLKLPSNSKIGILSKNCAHWIMSDLAIMMSGHISVPLYPNLNAETLEAILKHSETKVLFVGKLDDYKSMKDQALKINKWGKNVYVKIPVVNSKGFYTGKIIKELNQKKIKLNITAVYTAKQTKQILNSINKKTNLIISIFAGRAADTGKDPIPEFKKSILLAKKFSNVEILWASVREPYNYLQSKQLGCHIITIPPTIIEKIEKFGKSFSKLTKETVKNFLNDSRKSKFKI